MAISYEIQLLGVVSAEGFEGGLIILIKYLVI